MATRGSHQPLCKFQKTGSRKRLPELATNPWICEQQMSTTLVQLDIRCKQHWEFTPECGACCSVRRFDTEFDRRRQGRAELLRQQGGQKLDSSPCLLNCLIDLL
jgi:hypothetical protein